MRETEKQRERENKWLKIIRGKTRAREIAKKDCTAKVEGLLYKQSNKMLFLKCSTIVPEKSNHSSIHPLSLSVIPSASVGRVPTVFQTLCETPQLSR